MDEIMRLDESMRRANLLFVFLFLGPPEATLLFVLCNDFALAEIHIWC
jgi:hypothetical protein